MGTQTLSDEELLELEDSWREENHVELATRLGGEWEDVEDIRWVDDVIEID